MPAPVIYTITDRANSRITVGKQCVFCGASAQVTLPQADYDRWDEGNGPPVHVACPGLSNDEYEILITGSHPACFDAAWEDDSGVLV